MISFAGFNKVFSLAGFSAGAVHVKITVGSLSNCDLLLPRPLRCSCICWLGDAEETGLVGEVSNSTIKLNQLMIAPQLVGSLSISHEKIKLDATMRAWQWRLLVLYSLHLRKRSCRKEQCSPLLFKRVNLKPMSAINLNIQLMLR
ncbi:uncharacterized protein LOC113280858 isoform X2 [Papaver somniferum]|uniref:uncharacterized protein LOC113280858 isoform X2 n=1 Tax=Papaver somniferum TaxID=3469 RepID=UPI000E6FB1AD|nr:uncharacterized protein LOC113280858 isoform X2 [Papaver somniferum]